MSFFPPDLGRARVGIASVCALLVLGTLAPAQARHEPEESLPAMTKSNPSTPRLSVPEYRSPLSAYQPYQESDSPGWIPANDRVGEIGGWRVYAREGLESADGSSDAQEKEKEKDAQ